MLLAVATLILIGAPSVDGTWVAILGVVTIGELIAVLVGIAVAATTGHHSLLVAVDAIVAVPLVVLVLSGLGSGGGAGGPISLVAWAMIVLAVGGGILAARVVRGRRIERVVLAFALVPIGAFATAFPVATLVPIAMLVVVFGPEPGWRPAPPRRQAAPDVRPAARIAPRRGAPDAAAVLARRPSDRPDPVPCADDPS